MSFVRRAIDIAVGAVGLAALSLAILVMTAISRLESGKSGIFQQVRYGKGGKPFVIEKIRTLDDNLNPLPICGRFRKLGLDEAPQLAHLITGEMSLVGPCPPPGC